MLTLLECQDARMSGATRFLHRTKSNPFVSFSNCGEFHNKREEEESLVILQDDSMSLSVIDQDCSFYQLKLIINEDKNN